MLNQRLVFFNFSQRCFAAFSIQVKFILQYIILFDAFVNGMVPLIFILDCPFLVYRATTEFHVLLRSFISSNISL